MPIRPISNKIKCRILNMVKFINTITKEIIQNIPRNVPTQSNNFEYENFS